MKLFRQSIVALHPVEKFSIFANSLMAAVVFLGIGIIGIQLNEWYVRFMGGLFVVLAVIIPILTYRVLIGKGLYYHIDSK